MFLLERRLSQLETASSDQFAEARVSDAVGRMAQDTGNRAEWIDRRLRLVQEAGSSLADSFKDTAATANIIVVNAILTPRMREEDPDKPFRSFTSAEQIAEAIAFVCSDAAAKMNGKRLSLHP